MSRISAILIFLYFSKTASAGRLKYQVLSTEKKIFEYSGLVVNTPTPDCFAININFLENTYISQKMFNRTCVTEVLRLSGTQVTRLEGNLFQNMNITLRIVVQETKLAILEKFTFANLEIPEVVITRNSVEVIEEKAFYNLPSLRSLELQENSILKLNPESFVALPKLELLDISLNRIEKVGKRAFGFVKRAIILRLACNNLLTIDDMVFDGIPPGALLTVDFWHNQLESIPTKAFKGHTFPYIDLRYNKISDIPDDFFTEDYNIHKFYIGDNLLEEDDLKKLEKWAEAHNITTDIDSAAAQNGVSNSLTLLIVYYLASTCLPF